jgi:rhomboid-like protein
MFPRLISKISESGAASATVTAAAKGKLFGRTVPDILPSLGASGAIYAAVTMTALGFPNVMVSLIFLPAISVPIQYGVGALVVLDAVGVYRGWR